MLIKQKLVLLAIIFGLAFSISIALSPGTVLAQGACDDPASEECAAACEADPETEGCEAAGSTAGDNKNPLDCEKGSENCCGGVKTSIISGDVFCGDGSEDPVTGSAVWGLLLGALKILTAGVGVAAVGGVVYGAILYASAENSPEQTKKAKDIITNVIIGLVAYALMYLILNYLIPGGILN